MGPRKNTLTALPMHQLASVFCGFLCMVIMINQELCFDSLRTMKIILQLRSDQSVHVLQIEMGTTNSRPKVYVESRALL